MLFHIQQFCSLLGSARVQYPSSGANLCEDCDAQVRYLGLMDALRQLMLDPNLALSAAVYTELSDVEAEINGLITYDRQVGATASC